MYIYIGDMSLSVEGVIRRDEVVFKYALEHKTPILMVYITHTYIYIYWVLWLYFDFLLLQCYEYLFVCCIFFFHVA